MILKGLVRLVPCGWAGGTRALVDLLASRYAFEATDAQRAEIARRADEFLASPGIDDEDARGLKLDLRASDWRTRAEAASRLSVAGAWTPWDVAGSLGAGSSSSGDARLASAIMVAARETLRPGTAENFERARGSSSAAIEHEKDGAEVWDGYARPLASEFAVNSRAHGVGRMVSVLRALSALAHLKGRALHSSVKTDPFLLGSAAATLLRGETVRRTSDDGLASLAAGIASLNASRVGFWEELDGETARLMGASAAFSVFGRGAVSEPRPYARPLLRASAEILPESAHARASLTADEAAAALDELACDPRLDTRTRRRVEDVSDDLKRHPLSHAVSCAEALGMDSPEPREADMSPGMKVYRAATGRRPIVCEGKNGRPVRCRTVAGHDGAIVGYLAYDALSREFGGRPLYAAYALDGKRYGYAWAEGRPVIRHGEPEQGFMTAPESMPI